MPTDIPVLILANANSRLLPAEIAVPLRETVNISSFFVKDSDIARCRLFLSSVGNMNHTLDSSMQKVGTFPLLQNFHSKFLELLQEWTKDCRDREASLSQFAIQELQCSWTCAGWLVVAETFISSGVILFVLVYSFLQLAEELIVDARQNDRSLAPEIFQRCFSFQNAYWDIKSSVSLDIPLHFANAIKSNIFKMSFIYFTFP